MSENKQTVETKSERASRWLVETGNALGRVIAPIAFVLIIAAVSMYAWDQIETLFRTTLAQRSTIINVPVSHFAAAASVGMALVMLAISKYAQHAAVRAGATIWAVVYITVSFLLVFIAWGLSAATGDGKNVALQGVVSDAASILPFLPLIGSAAVVVLASLGLACFGVLVGASKNHPDRFETENRARGHLIGNFAKVVVSLASVGFSIWFGVTVLGVNAALAALLGLVLDIGLINSWSKSESAAEGGDMDEAARWRGWAYVFGFSVALMAVESVGTQFKTSAAQGNAAVSPQLAGLLNSPVFGLMQAVGAVAIICAIGLSIVQLLLTMRPIKKTPTAKTTSPATSGGYTVNNPSLAHRLGGFAARPMSLVDDFNEGRKGARKTAPVDHQLNPGMTLADESPLSPKAKAAALNAVMVEAERLKGNAKTSETGVPYDTTGVVSDAPVKGWPTQEELQAHRKWVEDNRPK